MANERKTENLVREALRGFDYYEPSKTIKVEEQKSEIEQVKKQLKSASKTGKGGIGAPEFLITDLSVSDFLLVIECKADTKHHESLEGNNPVEYAVDGAARVKPVVASVKRLKAGYRCS